MGTAGNVFAFAHRSGSEPANPYQQTSRVTLAGERDSTAWLELVASAPDEVARLIDPTSGCAIYQWGRAVHPRVAEREALLRWVGQTVTQGHARAFRELIGCFVFIVEDRRRQRVSFVSDVLGIRPWFVGEFDGRLVSGSDVLSIHAAGLSRGQVDYDALSSWMKYNYDCNGRTLLTDYQTLLPGAVCTYASDGRLLEQVDYAAFEPGEEMAPRQQVVAELHERVAHAFRLLTAGQSRLTLPLSGGFDSRYLMALARRQAQADLSAVVVRKDSKDTAIAEQVAQALNHPLHAIDVGNHVLDLYDDPFAFSPSGFPAGRNLTSAVARWRSDVPVLSGFLGDSIVRGSNDRCFGKRESEFDGADLASVLQRRHALPDNRFELVDPRLVRRIDERSLASMRNAAEKGRALGKPFLYVDLYCRQRRYISSIFLQHRDVAEALLPFYTWDLIAYRLRHSYECFRWENYPLLFEMFFPELSHIPHNTRAVDGGAESSAASKPTRHLRRWVVQLSAAITAGGYLSLLNGRKWLSPALSGLRGRAGQQREIIYLAKLHAFERRLRRAGIAFDWHAI